MSNVIRWLFIKDRPSSFLLTRHGLSYKYCKFIGGVAQLVRARGSYPRSPGFEALHRHSHQKGIPCRSPFFLPFCQPVSILDLQPSRNCCRLARWRREVVHLYWLRSDIDPCGQARTACRPGLRPDSRADCRGRGLLAGDAQEGPRLPFNAKARLYKPFFS